MKTSTLAAIMAVAFAILTAVFPHGELIICTIMLYSSCIICKAIEDKK